jgi:hypothetical protein
LRTVFVVLYILRKGTVGVDGEDVAVARVVIEGVAVHGVGGFAGRKKEDGAGLGGGIFGLLYTASVSYCVSPITVFKG